MRARRCQELVEQIDQRLARRQLHPPQAWTTTCPLHPQMPSSTPLSLLLGAGVLLSASPVAAQVSSPSPAPSSDRAC